MTAARSRMVQQPLPFMPVLGDATISECGMYRYTLSRSLDHLGVNSPITTEGIRRRRCLFVMLNPSVADALVNDPTIEKIIKFARELRLATSSDGTDFELRQHHVLDVGNLYAYRATDPKELRRAAAQDVLGLGTRIIGPDNDVHLSRMAYGAETVVIGWGANSPLPERAGEVINLLRAAQARRFGVRHEETTLYCLKQNKDGSPIHPLYQRDDSQFVPYVEPA